MYLKIANNGEMEKEALTLLGGSSKRNQSGKIGMFGSGNKYAIAYLLRQEMELRVFSGENEIVLTTKSKNFRGTDLEVICVDGAETSITTNSGPQWEFWHAIREIYSNALDEGLIELGKTPEIFPIKGETQFYLKWNNEVSDFYTNFGKYFASKRIPIVSNEHGKIYERSFDESYVYRKGIRCYVSRKGLSLYDYDFENLKINESREVYDKDNMYSRIADVLYSTSNFKVIDSFYKNVSETKHLEYSVKHSWISTNPSLLHPEWQKRMPKKYICLPIHALILTEYEIEECHPVSERFYFDMEKRFGDKVWHPVLRKDSKGRNREYRILEKSARHQAYISSVDGFFKESGYKMNCEIELVKFTSKQKTGNDNNKILLTEECFSNGKSHLINQVLHEYFKIKSDMEGGYTLDKAVSEMVNYMAESSVQLL